MVHIPLAGLMVVQGRINPDFRVHLVSQGWGASRTFVVYFGDSIADIPFWSCNSTRITPKAVFELFRPRYYFADSGSLQPMTRKDYEWCAAPDPASAATSTPRSPTLKPEPPL